MILLQNSPDKYFIGSYTPNGYKSSFEDLISQDEFYTYILSDNFIDERADFLQSLSENEKADEIFYCTFYTKSIDAVVFTDEKTAFADGNFPHFINPKYNGFTSENLPTKVKFSYNKIINSQKEGLFLWKEYEKNLSRCEKYLKAVSHILDDIKSIANSSLDIKKLDSYISRLCKKEFPIKVTSKKIGTIKNRYISALTTDGYKTFFPNASKIFLLNDNFFTGTNYILRKITNYLLPQGYDVIVSLSPVSTEEFYEHIYIPKLKIAFISSSILNKISLSEKNVINFARFYDKTILASKKARLKFNTKTASSILSEAISSLKLAKIFNTKIYNLLQENIEKNR